MSKLFNDFISTAEQISHILVYERSFPNAKKSLKPVVTSGIAGGNSRIFQEF